MGGYLKSTILLPGAPVAKGQVVGMMEDQSFIQLQQDYLTARAKISYLAAEATRQKELSEADASSKKSYQLASGEYAVQEVLVRSFAEKLRLIHVDPDKLNAGSISATVPLLSPINGFVSKVNVNVGKYVNPSDVLFELINPDDIHAAITVFENDVASFKRGMHGRVALVDQPDKWYDIETILVTRNVDERRTGLVHCHFEKPGRDLLPGMYLTAEFDMDSRQTLTVPEDAVLRYMGKEYIFVTGDDSHFRLTEVQAGGRDGGRVELLPGAADWQKEKVVVRGAFALLGKLKNKMED
jgi:cobalt-zinc-cadmium efflux system membrane fusion protein